MTALLQEAIRETTALSESEQDFVAALVLENIRDARHWDAQFAASKEVLEEFFDEAMDEYRTGKTTPINA